MKGWACIAGPAPFVPPQPPPMTQSHPCHRTPSRVHLVLGCFLALAVVGQAAEESSKPKSAQQRRGVAFFEEKIRPVLIERCYECHSAQSEDLGGELLLDSRMGMRTGGDSGPAVVPKDLEASLLLSAIEYRDFEMPPDGRLPENVVRDFRHWVSMGAPDPRDEVTRVAEAEDDWSERKQLWSLQPVADPPLPVVDQDDWPQKPADYFVLARQEQRGVRPVGDAEPLTWLRRVSFDLAGLPPTLSDIRTFSGEPTLDDYRELVDRLLAEPQFGERWARHWLDVVRYGESAGSSRDVLMIYAWRYRDYVIDALNADVPYDRFLTEQIAGDLLPADTAEERDRLKVATGLLAIGSKSLNGGNLQLDIIDDQIDVISKSILGFTVSCARCHDHKFDPIKTADYYAMAGIFQSTETFYGGSTRRPKNLADRLSVYLTLGEDADEEQAKQVAGLTKRIDKLQKQEQNLRRSVNRLKRKLAPKWQDKYAKLLERQRAADASKEKVRFTKKEREILNAAQQFESTSQKLRKIKAELKPLLKQQEALPESEYYVGVREAEKIANCAIRIRGEKNQRGEVPPRGFLSLVKLSTEPTIPVNSSGRRELAEWLTSSDHPLTSRVIVNRVWQHLFGRGLVESVDNFGMNGAEPTHPQLLDHLAYRFVHVHQWSLKSLIRELVLSRTYRLAGAEDAANIAIDEANELLWRHNRRRLEAESLRDAMLFVSGQIDLERPYASAVHEIGEGEVGRNLNTKPLETSRRYRSVYLPVVRGLIPEVLRVFDFPDPSNPQGVRDETNVPTQALYLMNSPFVIEQATAMARRVVADSDDRPNRIQQAYQLAFGRLPASEEQAAAEEFLQQVPTQQVRQSSGMSRELVAWTSLCQAFLASADFRYLD